MEKISQSPMYHILDGNWYFCLYVYRASENLSGYYPREDWAKLRHFDCSTSYEILAVNKLEEAIKKSGEWLQEWFDTQKVTYPDAILYPTNKATLPRRFWEG